MTRSFIPTVCMSIVILIALAVTETESANASASQPTSPDVPLCKSIYKKKSVPAKTLQALIRSHERWVEYRGNPTAKRLELCQADLSRAALSEANLERADLEGAVLRQANLSQATLVQASLAGTDLSKARLEDSNLSGADLRRARLAGANLSRAIGDEAALLMPPLVAPS